MPTRPQVWRFLAIYDGFEHGGLRAEVDRDASTPLNRAGRVVRLEGRVVDERGRRVGHFTRMLASGGEGLRARHEKIVLEPEARGRGFARALHAHAEDTYRRMGVGFVTMHAENVGSLLWPRLGFDFDLRHMEGADELERRAHAVLKLLSPRARKVEGLPRPAELLARWAASDDATRRDAAAALRAVLPSAQRLQAGELDGLLLHPLALGEFHAGASGLGPTLMLGASWDAYKSLVAPAEDHTRAASDTSGDPDGAAAVPGA
ncbi:MAG TPA: GNAT family N-acetyltransferase [Solirubrobacteraceae bacterium]|jgi:GNAT superfamily N-acetyltransferase|nr:GNAT family N-acetyltransferase [Solirubrobacteraceae bacterium]